MKASAPIFLILLLFNSTCCVGAEELRLVIPQPGSLEPAATSQYYEKALRLALEKTSPQTQASDATAPERIIIEYYAAAVGRERFRLLVRQGAIDVMWSSSSKKREEEMAVVKFNLLRGINEYRVLLIRAEDQRKFAQIKTLADLQQFKIGTGSHWSDTEVYIANGLPVVTSYAYEPMFRMLAAKRFDYMARSMQEIDHEVKKHGNMGLSQEKNLLIHYAQPIYFFLALEQQTLANRIQRGLEIAQADGSLDELFMSIDSFRVAQEKLHHINRHIIELTPAE